MEPLALEIELETTFGLNKSALVGVEILRPEHAHSEPTAVQTKATPHAPSPLVWAKPAPLQLSEAIIYLLFYFFKTYTKISMSEIPTKFSMPTGSNR